MDIGNGISQCTILENAALHLDQTIDWRTETCGEYTVTFVFTSYKHTHAYTHTLISLQ